MDNKKNIASSAVVHTKDSAALCACRFYIDPSNNYKPIQFYILLQSCIKKEIDILKLRDEDGLSLFHIIVLNNREDLIVVLYDLGLLKDLHSAMVRNPSSRYAYMTPSDLALYLKRPCANEIEKFLRNESYLSPACRYARAGDVQKLEALLKEDHMNAHYMGLEDGTFPIYWAIVANSYPCLQMLLENGADITCATRNGENVLVKACSLGHEELVVKLISQLKLDPNIKNRDGISPLDKAAETGQFTLFQKIVDAGASCKDCSFLHCAAKEGNVAFIKKLMKEISNYVNINAIDQDHRTPLHYSAIGNSTEVLRLLLEMGADFSIRDHKNRSALHYAIIQENYEQCVELMLRGCDLATPDCFGLLPIHLAAVNGSLQLIKEIEKFGGNLNVEDNKGRTPLMIAHANNNRKVMNYLSSDLYMDKIDQLVGSLSSRLDNLCSDKLTRIRASGKNVGLYVTAELRNIVADIHNLLFEIGTAPIEQEKG